MSKARTRQELITQAIKEAGTTDIAAVALKLEDIMIREMESWPSFQKMKEVGRCGAVFHRLERMYIYTIGDLKAIITEVRRERKEEFRQALGM